MTSVFPQQSPSPFPALIREGDVVMITGGAFFRSVTIKANATLRLGRVGSVQLKSLIGQPFGEVFQFDEKQKVFVPSSAHPDLDRTDIRADADDDRDNRDLEDKFGASQQLTHDEVMELKASEGVEGLLEKLVESSATFTTKTSFSQEKYIRKKKVKYAWMFKVERVQPDNLAELQIPTIHCTDQPPEPSRFIRLRCDTQALILHYANIHSSSRVLSYDNTNGVLSAAILNRLADDGVMYQILDKVAHPNTVIARSMLLPNVKERWRAVPRNQPFLTGKDYEHAPRAEEEEKKETADVRSDDTTATHSEEAKRSDAAAEPPTTSLWVRGQVAREELLQAPADCLVVVDDENPVSVVMDLFPFLGLSGNLVVYCSFLDQLTEIFSLLRNDCVFIRISETWYRHHQVLTNRTHPTVNMSTGGGYLLTAVKVEKNAAPRPRYAFITDEAHGKYNTKVGKRPREE